MARYMVEDNYIEVIGPIWMPAITAAMRIPLRAYDLDNMRNGEEAITREDIEHWLTLNTGDFQYIEDFHASIGDQEFPWQSEENECIYLDCMSEEYS